MNSEIPNKIRAFSLFKLVFLKKKYIVLQVDQEYEKKYQNLKTDYERIKSELEGFKKNKQRNSKTIHWIVKRGLELFAGKGLKRALQDGIDEFNENKKISSKVISNIGANVFWRITRIGFFGILIGLLPSILLVFQLYYLKNQNTLIKSQNNRLEQQTYLQEANRRSSLVFSLSNVMDAVDKELKDSNNSTRDLSRQLIGRIVSLSRSLKPYRYLAKDTLTPLLSPERTQLLINLINADLGQTTYKDIFAQGDFSYLELKEYTFDQMYFGDINFDHSIIDYVKFRDCTFNSTTFVEVQANEISFESCDFQRLYIKNSKFNRVDFYSCFFGNEFWWRNSYAQNIRYESSTASAIEFDGSFEEFLIRQSYTSFFKYIFDPTSFTSLAASPYPFFDELNNTTPTLSSSGAFSISDSYAMYLKGDARLLEKAVSNESFKFYRFYLNDKNDPYILANKQRLSKYYLDVDLEIEYPLSLTDSLYTPNKIWDLIYSITLKDDFIGYPNESKFIEKSKILIDRFKERVDFDSKFGKDIK